MRERAGSSAARSPACCVATARCMRSACVRPVVAISSTGASSGTDAGATRDRPSCAIATSSLRELADACACRRASRGPLRGTSSASALAIGERQPAVSAVAAVRAVGVVEQAAHHRRERRDHPERAAVAAAHLDELLEPALGEQRRQVQRPVRQRRVLAVPAVAHERRNVRPRGHRQVAAAVDEVHRHVERPLGVRAEDVVALEHERQQAGARVVGVAPDPRAIALIAAELARRRSASSPTARSGSTSPSRGSAASRRRRPRRRSRGSPAPSRCAASCRGRACRRVGMYARITS